MSTQLREKIDGWIRRLGSTVTGVDDPEAEWHLRFDYPARSPHTMHAAQPKGQDGAVLLAFVLDVSHEHLEAFEELDADSQRKFLWDLGETINVIDVDFRMEGIEKEGDCPRRIQLMATRYADGLTMDSFARSVGAIFKTFLNAVWTVQRHLAPESSGPGGRFDFKKLGT